jgi:hypothetical protein
VTHLLLEGPDGRTYIARKAELSNVPWAYDRESWLVTEFNHGTNPPTDWWIEESVNQWGRSQTYDNLDKFTILASHSDGPLNKECINN